MGESHARKFTMMMMMMMAAICTGINTNSEFFFFLLLSLYNISLPSILSSANIVILTYLFCLPRYFTNR
ncbi:hypothetical protein V8C37DRAFT_106324 [Trichoderma ceciliae]